MSDRSKDPIAIFIIEACFDRDDNLCGTTCHFENNPKLFEVMARSIVGLMKNREDFEKAMLDTLAQKYGRKDC